MYRQLPAINSKRRIYKLKHNIPDYRWGYEQNKVVRWKVKVN